MAVDATMHLTHPGRRDAFLDWIQMLSGATLILFMWSHMILVSSVILSPKLMDAIAWFFEATFMAQIGGPVIFCIFLAHFVLAARKMPFKANDQQTIWSHARLLKHRDTWLWLVQAGTAMIILIMGGYVGGAQRSAHRGVKVRSPHVPTRLDAVLSHSPAHGGNARFRRLLSYRRQMGDHLLRYPPEGETRRTHPVRRLHGRGSPDHHPFPNAGLIARSNHANPYFRPSCHWRRPCR